MSEVILYSSQKNVPIRTPTPEAPQAFVGGVYVIHETPQGYLAHKKIPTPLGPH